MQIAIIQHSLGRHFPFALHFTHTLLLDMAALPRMRHALLFCAYAIICSFNGFHTLTRYHMLPTWLAAIANRNFMRLLRCACEIVLVLTVLLLVSNAPCRLGSGLTTYLNDRS